MKNSYSFGCIRQVGYLTAILVACWMTSGLRAMVPGDDASFSPGSEMLGGQQGTDQPDVYRSEMTGLKVTPLLGGLGLENAPHVNRLVQEAEETARRLELDIEAKVASLKRTAEESIDKMKTNVEERATKLKRDSEIEAQRVRQRAQQETDKLFKQASEQASGIAKKVENEADKLKKDAAVQVVSIINKAEEEHLKLRRKAREDAIFSRLSRKSVRRAPLSPAYVRMVQPALASEPAKQAITREWRHAMVNEFNAHTLLMKQIIMEGEDAEQLPDFLQRFNDQRLWFDRTLRGTQYVNDPNYHQVVNKQLRLRKVVKAQRKADGLLIEVAQKLKLGDYERKKIRLLALYELNAFAHKELLKGAAGAQPKQQQNDAPRHVKFTDQVIRHLVLKVAHEVTGRVKQAYPDFKVLDDKAVIQLAVGLQLADQDSEVKKLRSMLDVASQEKHVVKGQMKQKFEEQGKELTEHQLAAKRLEFELARLRQQAEADKSLATSDVRELMKREFSVKLEEKDRERLDLKLQLTSANQRVDVLDKQLKEAKDNLDRMNIELLMAKDDARMAKKHVDDLQREVEEQRKAKNLALDKVKLIDEVADRRIEEHVGVATQRLAAERQDIKKLEISFKEKEEALKKAERELQDKERLLNKKEQEAEEQRKLFDDMRKSIKDSTRVVTEVANRQVLKAELKDKKHDQADTPKTEAAMPVVSTPMPVETPAPMSTVTPPAPLPQSP